MIYRQFKDTNLSMLGLGNMRLPVIDSDDSKIDEELVAKMYELAFANGINYFDTAYGYHGGNSEIVVGKMLKKYPRDSYYLASKWPGFSPDNFKKVGEIFEEQLSKLQIDYFDFYLLHNVSDGNVDNYLNEEEFHIMEYMLEQKKNGRIKHLGFSTHASYENFCKFLDVYAAEMEFCQIELNYIDWDLQDAKLKVEKLNELNIPIWVMEPVRGGRLANLPDEFSAKLKALRPDDSMASWCFRYLESIPGVTMILSGMSNMEQMIDNIKTFETEDALNQDEIDLLVGIGHEMVERASLPCTACHYCIDKCPQEIPIPEVIKMYNEAKFSGNSFGLFMLTEKLPEGKKPENCVGCCSCEAVCPQNIKISEMMASIPDIIMNGAPGAKKKD